MVRSQMLSVVILDFLWVFPFYLYFSFLPSSPTSLSPDDLGGRVHVKLWSENQILTVSGFYKGMILNPASPS